MNKTTISFLSTRGRAMNIDLKLIQDYLASNLSDITLEYYLKNTATKIPATNKQLETARLSFCNNTSNIICIGSFYSGEAFSCLTGRTATFNASPL